MESKFFVSPTFSDCCVLSTAKSLDFDCFLCIVGHFHKDCSLRFKLNIKQLWLEMDLKLQGPVRSCPLLAPTVRPASKQMSPRFWVWNWPTAITYIYIYISSWFPNLPMLCQRGNNSGARRRGAGAARPCRHMNMLPKYEHAPEVLYFVVVHIEYIS